MGILSYNYNNSDRTVFALSTVYGQSGIAIIRITGSNFLLALEKFSIRMDNIEPRYCHLITLRDEEKIIDHALMIYFKGPNSFTGEDLLEFHLHGSKAVINLVLSKLAEIENFSPADPGEFTRRAFQNGKLDLVQAEGLLAVIHSETEEQLFQANRQLSGENSQIFLTLRNQILQIFANCEALLDFPEDDLEDEESGEKVPKIEENIFQQLKTIQLQLEEFLFDSAIGEKIYSGFKVAIVGEPNVGKSSLINFLAKKPVAIVSEIAGTTRDLISVSLNIGGYQVELIDTAGIRDTTDKIESIGVARAKEIIENVELVLVLTTLDKPLSYKDFIKDSKNHILILNKMDDYHQEFFEINEQKYLAISIENDLNLDFLIDQIKVRIKNLIPSHSPVITSKRQRTIMEKLYSDLKQILETDYPFLDILTEDIRNLAFYISQLTGSIATDEILEELFCNFCIGK